MHIYFNWHELNFTEEKAKHEKEGYKIIKPSKDHPFRKLNQRLKEDKRRNLLLAALE
jgi:hypothetical protein